MACDQTKNCKKKL